MVVALAPRLFGVEDYVDVERDEYLTPPWLFERLAIRFDLDVAAPPGGVPWIPAERSYAIADDGLALDWSGRVWMNPPYSNAAPWVARFIEHGDGIALVPACRARWFSRLWATADALVDPNPANPSGALFQFLRRGRIVNVYMPVLLAAFGAASVEALARVARPR